MVWRGGYLGLRGEVAVGAEPRAAEPNPHAHALFAIAIFREHLV